MTMNDTIQLIRELQSVIEQTKLEYQASDSVSKRAELAEIGKLARLQIAALIVGDCPPAPDGSMPHGIMQPIKPVPGIPAEDCVCFEIGSLVTPDMKVRGLTLESARAAWRKLCSPPL